MRKLILAALIAASTCPAIAQNFSGNNTNIATIPTVQNASYSASNSLGGLQTIPFFRPNGPRTGILDGALVGSVSGSTSGVTLYLFFAKPAGTCNDKAAISFGADVKYLVPGYPVSLTPTVGQGATMSNAANVQAVSVANGDSLSGNGVAPSNNLYACLVANTTITPPTTTDYVIALSGALD